MSSKRPARSIKNQPTDESTAKKEKKEKLAEPADISDPVWFPKTNIQSVIDENVNQKSVVSQINHQDKETTDSNENYESAYRISYENFAQNSADNCNNGKVHESKPSCTMESSRGNLVHIKSLGFS